METETNREDDTPEPEIVPDEGPEMESEEKAEETVEAEPRRPSVVINVYSWATPIVGVLMLVIGLLAGYFGRPLIGATPKAEPTVPAAAVQSANPTDEAQRKEMMTFLVGQVKHFKGDPNAPVTIIEFSDYQWPYCGRFATGAGRQIDEKYVNEGKVRFGYWHVAFLGQESADAAAASECAADQDAFWEYHDILFERQKGENQGAFSKENLKQFAADLKLDTQVFNDCVDSGKYTQEVQEATQAANSMGVNSTPAFVVNGQAIMGAQPYEVFEQTIEAELSKAAP